MTRVVVVGCDGFDAQIAAELGETGGLPTFRRLCREGVSGPLHLIQPPRPALSWASALTGDAPHEHGVTSERVLDFRTGIVDDATLGESASQAVWQRFAAKGRRSIAINWPFRTVVHNSDNDLCIPGRFFDASRSDRDTIEGGSCGLSPQQSQWIEDLRVAPREVDLDTIRAFVPQIDLIEHRSDQRIGYLAHSLASAFSVHAVATHLLETGRSEFFCVRYNLISRLSDAFGIYRSPQHDVVSDRDFETFNSVVDAAHRLIDLFLARLLDLAGEKARVILVSNGGYRQGGARPPSPPRTQAEADAWRGRQGFAVLAGADIAPGTLSGVHLRGLAPTICALGELDERHAWRVSPWVSPAGAEPLELVVQDPTQSQLHDNATPHASSTKGRLAALLSRDETHKAAMAHLEGRYAMALSLSETGQIDPALALLEEITALSPGEHRWEQLFLNLALERRDGALARERVAALSSGGAPRDVILVSEARIRLMERAPAAAFEALEKAEIETPVVLGCKAACLAELRRWDEAEVLYSRVIQADPRASTAYVGLARCLLAQDKSEAVISLAQESVTAFGETPIGSYYLGTARYRCGDADRAIAAWQRCIALAPGFAPAYRRLSAVLRYDHSEPAQAAMYDALGRAAYRVGLSRRAGRTAD